MITMKEQKLGGGFRLRTALEYASCLYSEGISIPSWPCQWFDDSVEKTVSRVLVNFGSLRLL